MRREPWKSTTWKRISYVVWTCCWWVPVLIVQMAAYNGLINAWVGIGLYFGFLILTAYAYGACKDQADRAAVAEHRIKWAREHGLDDGWPNVST